jgi:hypothetical protein
MYSRQVPEAGAMLVPSNMGEQIAARISRQSGVPGLVEVLARKIPPSDLKSLLLKVLQIRSSVVNDTELLRAAESSSLLRPTDVDARLLALFDRTAFETAAGFDAVDLSPVIPFGTSHVLGAIDQNSVLTTIRNAEVPGDCTSALAIECALRRKRASRQREATMIRLCASQRVIRLQPFDMPGFSPHFRLFGLVTAGRDTGSSAFEVESLIEHIDFYLRLFQRLNAEGFSLRVPLVQISDTAATRRLLADSGVPADEVRARVRAHKPGEAQRLLKECGVDTAEGRAVDTPLLGLVRQHVFARLRAAHPDTEFHIDSTRLEGLSYYDGLCLRISPTAPDGQRYGIIDGGFTNWTARLLQNRKERLLTSGIGSEFVCRRFRATST